MTMKSRIETPLDAVVVGPEARQGAQTYSTALQGAGGEQVQALTRGADARAVCAALYAVPPYDLRVPCMAVSRLSLNLTPARVVGGIEGERARSYDAHRYSRRAERRKGAGLLHQQNWRRFAPFQRYSITPSIGSAGTRHGARSIMPKVSA